MGLIVHLFSVSHMYTHHHRGDNPRPCNSDLRETKVTVVVFAVPLKGLVINGMFPCYCFVLKIRLSSLDPT